MTQLSSEEWAAICATNPGAPYDPMKKMRRVQSGMHSYKERGLDLNETPECITRALLSTGELTNKSIWEPACGRGAISKVLKDSGYNVWSTDIFDYGYGDEHFDFLTWGAVLR